MNRPSFFKNIIRSDRGLTVCLFTVMIICISVTIHVVPMPTRASIEQSLEVFVLESMAMAANRSDEPEPTNEIEEAIAEEESLEDFDELLSSFTDMSLSEPSLENIESQDRITESNIQTDLNLNFNNLDEQETLEFGSSDLDADLFLQADRSNGIPLRRKLVSGFTHSGDIQFTNGTGGLSAGDLTIRQEDSTRAKILESVYDGLDRSTLTAEEIAREDAVVLWMTTTKKLNLDPVIHTMLDLKSSDLSIKDTITLEDQSWTIQVSYSPTNRTLRIILIQDTMLFYFIDPGLQDRVNYFEKGHVKLDPNGQVMVVESEEVSAQNTDAVRVFNLFQSWWKNEIKSDG